MAIPPTTATIPASATCCVTLVPVPVDAEDAGDFDNALLVVTVPNDAVGVDTLVGASRLEDPSFVVIVTEIKCAASSVANAVEMVETLRCSFVGLTVLFPDFTIVLAKVDMWLLHSIEPFLLMSQVAEPILCKTMSVTGSCAWK